MAQIEEGILISIGAKVDGAIANVNKFESTLNKLPGSVNKTVSSLNSSTGAINKTTKNFTGLSRVIQDLPFGFIGIQNNLTQLLPAAGLLGVGLSVLTTTITFLTTGLSNWTRGMSGAGSAANNLKTSAQDLNAAIAGDNYKEAITNVALLKENIQLAKDGFIDKESVLKQYNETIGKTTGQVTSLDQAEAALIKNGDAYVKMTLYKAAANIALEEAAKKAVEAEQIRIKKDKEFSKTLIDTRISRPGGSFNAKEYEQDTKRILDAQKNRKAAQVKEAQDAANVQINIAKDFQKQAATISKDFKFDFFGGEFDSKAKKDKIKKTVNDVLADLKKAVATTDNLELIEKITPTAADEERLKSYSKALKELFDLGSNSKSASVIGVIAQMQPVEARIDQQKLKEAIDKVRIEDVPLEVPIEPKPVISNASTDSSFDKFGEVVRATLLAKLKGRNSVKGSQGISVPIGLANNAELQGQIDEDAEKLNNLLQIGQKLQGVFENVFTGIMEGGGNALKVFGQFIKQIITKLLAAAAVAAILAVLTGGLAAGGGKTGGGLGFKALFSQFSGLKLASGGVVTSPSLAMIGEGGEPEAVIPLSRLEGMMEANRGGGDGGGILETRISGDDLIILLNRANNRRGRSYG